MLLMISPVVGAQAATYYVATSGTDTNSGTLASPFATVQRAQKAAAAGDIVYIRGGTYVMAEAQIASTSGVYAYVTNLNKNGSAGARINYWAYPGERPIFDLSNVKPADFRVVAFNVPGSWIHLRGLEIVGVQVTITTHTQSECFENTGSNNIYEQCVMHDGMGIGFYLTKGSNNLVLNCDAYRNWDSVSEGGVGGNVDGFGGHPTSTSYTGNVFRGCRAWFNSDDGYDCINAYTTVMFENCWAFANGYTSDFVSRGDGNGFKSGGYGAAGGAVPSPIPRHMTQFCLAVRNKTNGFYSNHHVGGSDWISNTSYQNATNYNMLSTLADNNTDVAGYNHYMRNNLSFSPRSTTLSNLDQSQSDVASNFFTLPVTASSADFASVTTSTSQLEQIVTQPRKANGDLPDIALLHLVSGSDLIDVGALIGYPFADAAPDLGAFEYNAATTARTLTWKGDGSANTWDLNKTANWLHGTIPAKFAPPDALLFDDAGSSSPSVGLSGQLWPGSVLVSGTKSYTFSGSGVLGGTMSLTKTGDGKLTITGTHNYSGATTIAGGKVELNGVLNGTAITVQNGGTLFGVGTITGDVTVLAGGAITRGGVINGSVANAGTFTLTSGTLTASSVINSGTLRALAGTAFVVSGTVTNTGLLDLMTSSTLLPTHLVNNGTVLTAGSARIDEVALSGSTFTVRIQGYTSHGYQLQRSPTLTAWTNVGAAQSGTGGMITFTGTNSAGDKNFYRVMVAP
jgi:autotransporter-associated beta strand protein/parallel beta-helix repeat protein